MTDSTITRSAGGIMYAGPDATELFRVMTLQSGLRLLKVGIAPTRGLTSTRALAMVTRYTGQKYRRTEHDRAIQDLTVWIENMKSAIPVERS